jgi:signal transduction histidine kinase
LNTRQFFGTAVPLLSIIAFVALLMYSLMVLSQINRVMRLEAPTNMLWVISQGESSSLKLEIAVLRFIDGQATAKELTRRYQVFLSRVHLLQQSPQKKALVAMGYNQELQALTQNLPKLVAAVEQLQQGNTSELPQLLNHLANHSKFLGQAANEAMVTGWDNLGQKLDDIRSQLWHILVAMVGLLLAGLILAIHLLLAMHRSRQNAAAYWLEKTNSEIYRNFGAMVSHQFRTPLAIIDSSLQRLIRRSTQLSPEEICEHGHKSRQAVARLLQLIESILEAARLESGQVDSYSRACNIHSLVVTCCAHTCEITTIRDIVINSSEEYKLTAYCDPVHSEQIIDNLLSNALKYSDKNSLVEITLQQNNEYIECTISNQGTLGKGATRDNLFQQYFRGQNSEGIKGLGIGLYMSKMLAQKQGGDIGVREENGRVYFCLQLPAVNK